MEQSIAVLLIQTGDRPAPSLRSGLEAENFSVVSSRQDDPQLILLDTQPPYQGDTSGICRRLRNTPGLERLPIIVLAAPSSEIECVQALESGANDYLVKPFSMHELQARARAQLRSSRQQAKVIRFGGLQLNCLAREVSLDGRRVPVTGVEFALLEYLMRHPGIVFSRQQLLDSVWGQSAQSTRTVDTYMYRLRRKIEANPGDPRWIASLSGFGYLFDPQPSPARSHSHPIHRNLTRL